MATLTREQFLALNDRSARDFESKLWGCTMKYRLATVADRAAARRRAQTIGKDGKAETDFDRFGAALVTICCLEPKFEPQDVDALMDRSAKEVEKLVNLILGDTPADPI